MSKVAPSWIRQLSKHELHALIADVKSGDRSAVARSIDFLSHESFGLWHNRARAKLCRFFKNHPPKTDECARLVDTICHRLLNGQFYEQFNDQMSMAIRLDRDRMANAATVAVESEREYIRRYGLRVLHAIDSIPRTPSGENLV